MAKLTFSAFGLHQAFSGITSSTRLFSIPGWPNSSPTNNQVYLLSGGAAGWCAIDIFRGTMPDVDSITDYNLLIPDLIVRLPQLPGNFNEDDSMSLTSSSKRYFIAKTSVVAITELSATATWFMMHHVSLLNQTNTDNKQLYPICIGNIGLLGSGADLEMPFVDLNIGDSIKCGGIRINIPTEWPM